jgi:TolB-like protein/Tfp pilus assembly protein PilF
VNAASFLAELRRRNVLRTGALYIGGLWALAQGIASLGPVFNAPDWITRWVVIGGAIGFPFWLLFAWFFELTPEGLRLEHDLAPGEVAARPKSRKLDLAIIGVLAVAVVLLLTHLFVARNNSTNAAIPEKSIAVLPLANESGNKDEQYFSDGLSEDLITALSHFDGVTVIGRNSAFQFRDSKEDSKAIGAKLGVANLLEGSVRRFGDMVRVTAELIHAASGRMLWTERFDRPYKDLFALQDDITNAVASALKAKLLADNGNAAAQTDRPPSGNLDAYNAYLQGNFFVALGTEADFRKAIDQYSIATHLDPKYALAWALSSLAWSNEAAGFLEGTAAEQAYAQAHAAAETALKLAPDLARAHVAQGRLLLNRDFDWAGAEAEARQALQLAPADGPTRIMLANLRATLGQPTEAVDLIRQALATDPLRAGWYWGLSGNLTALNRLDEADRAIRRAIELQPKAVSYNLQLATIEIQRGNAEAALAAAQREPPGVWQDEAVALARQIGTDRAAADAALKVLTDKYATLVAYQIAEVYALRDESDRVFEWLDRAWASRDTGIRNLLIDPFFKRYRDTPRFAAFCNKVGLPVPAKSTASSTPAASPPSNRPGP